MLHLTKNVTKMLLNEVNVYGMELLHWNEGIDSMTVLIEVSDDR